MTRDLNNRDVEDVDKPECKHYQPEPLSDDVKKTLREVVEDVEKELVSG